MDSFTSATMRHLGIIVCAKLKVKISVYFVTNVFNSILNITVAYK